MKARLTLVALALGLGGLSAADWRPALPGWRYEFPRDHGNHPDFKTEWWYFTGNLHATDGGKARDFGYQLTFFRQGVIPPAERREGGSRFLTNDLKFSHFAVSDLTSGRFLFGQILRRGAFGEAGFDAGKRLAWIEGCSLELRPDGTFHLVGRDAEKTIDLTLRTVKPPTIHGVDGVSQKADGVGRASHYYSLTRLETSGTITLGSGERIPVAGLSWFDHEWASNQLAENQVGWDWLSLQFDNGAELMLFQLRLKGGGRDPWSGGSWISHDGTVTRIADGDFSLEPLATWKSPATGAVYPTRWRVRVPRQGLDIEVRAQMDDQELRLSPVAYWEGAVRATGTHSGRGYLEMTGYAGAVVGLQAGE
jgi:predicted secreted hydrolase